MNSQRWKGAGIAFLIVAALLVVAALASVLTADTTGPIAIPYQSATITAFSAAAGVLRGVVLGAFAGVAFFIGLACFAWSAVGEAGQQRAEILAELTALRRRADQADQAIQAEQARQAGQTSRPASGAEGPGPA